MKASVPLDLADGRLAVSDTGAGSAVVMLHGMGSSHRSWYRIADPLAARRRVVAIDLPGFGGSDPAGPGFRPLAVARTLVDGLDALGVDEFDLVGHSLGGMVATRIADRFPARVRRLVLVAPAGLRPRLTLPAGAVGHAMETLIGVRRGVGPLVADRDAARRLIFRRVVFDGGRLPPEDARLVMTASRGATRIRQGIAAAIHGDIRPALARLPMPVDIVWGRQDRIMSVAGADQAAIWRPATTLHLLDRCGHLPMLELPDLFGAILDGALDGAA